MCYICDAYKPYAFPTFIDVFLAVVAFPCIVFVRASAVAGGWQGDWFAARSGKLVNTVQSSEVTATEVSIISHHRVCGQFDGHLFAFPVHI